MVDYIEHNPISPYMWKRDVGRGTDMVLVVGDTVLDVECKANYAPLYQSWILRDHIPRFMVDDVPYRIILTNNKEWYSRECRMLLSSNRISLMDLPQLLRLICTIRGVTNIVSYVYYNEGYTKSYRGSGIVRGVKCVKKETSASYQGKVWGGKAPLPATLRRLNQSVMDAPIAIHHCFNHTNVGNDPSLIRYSNIQRISLS